MIREAHKKVGRLQDSEIQDEFVVQNTYMADQILLRYGIISEEFNQAMSHYNLLES